MYHYQIYEFLDESIFHRQCAALEKHIPGLKKLEPIAENGSLTQIYQKGTAKISVHCNREIQAVYIKSELDLREFFPKARPVMVNMTLGLTDFPELMRDMFGHI